MEGTQSIIKNIDLHQWGRKEIQIAEVQMPGLIACRLQYGPKKPLQGARISGSLHMTIQTAVLIETLAALGAKVRWCSCNIYSTQDHAAAAVAKNGLAQVFAWKNQTIEEYWDLTLKTLQWPGNNGPTTIVDDGCDATLLLLSGMKWQKKMKQNREQLPNPQIGQSDDQKALLNIIKRQLLRDQNCFSNLSKDLKGVSQQTTTGVHRLYQISKQGSLPFPAINVNDSVTKSKFDNIYGCRHSLLDGIWRATDVMVAGKKCLIFGYGDVGKGCAASLKGAGAVVYIAQVDPICALQACMEGYQVKRKQTVLSQIDIFITATGNKKIILAEDMKKMKNNAIVGNIGHFDNQIDLKGLKSTPNIKHVNIKNQVDRYQFDDGHGIILLADGRLMNLGCATGHPSFVMSTSFTNQVKYIYKTLAQIELWTNRQTGKYKNEVYKLPKQLDQKVAKMHLKSLGAQLSTLSEEQSEYIHVSVDGPFKKDDYRY